MRNKPWLFAALFLLSLMLVSGSYYIYSNISQHQIDVFEDEQTIRLTNAAILFGARFLNVKNQLSIMGEVFVTPDERIPVSEEELRRIFKDLVLIAPNTVIAAIDTGKDEDIVFVKNDVSGADEVMPMLMTKLKELRSKESFGVSSAVSGKYQFAFVSVPLHGRKGSLVAALNVSSALRASTLFSGSLGYCLFTRDRMLIYSKEFEDNIGKKVTDSGISKGLKVYNKILFSQLDMNSDMKYYTTGQRPTVIRKRISEDGFDGFLLMSNVITGSPNDFIIAAYRPISLVSESLDELRNWILLLSFIFLVLPGVLLMRSYFRKSYEVGHVREVLNIFTDLTGDFSWDFNMLKGELELSSNGLIAIGAEETPVKLEKIFSILHPDDAERLKNSISEIQNNTTNMLDLELRFKSISGDYKWILVRGKAVEHSNLGNPLSLAGVGSNVDSYKMDSMVDILTKIWNRRYFERKLDEESARISRNGGSACICLGDLGEFKRVNDSYGHETGDEVLKAVAKIISANIRETDTAARLGGDEFVILFLNIGEKEADETLRRIQASVGDADIFGVRADGTRERVSIKIDFGMKFYPDEQSKSLAEAMKLADEIMYEKKQARKRVNGIHPR